MEATASASAGQVVRVYPDCLKIINEGISAIVVTFAADMHENTGTDGRWFRIKRPVQASVRFPKVAGQSGRIAAATRNVF